MPDFNNGSAAGSYQESGPGYTYDNQYKGDQGFQNRNSFGGVVGGADVNVNRYRQMGIQDASRGAYQGDYTNANQTRDMQMGSLALLDQRARGAAPSAAELSGRAAMDQSLANSVAVARSGRGGAAQQQAALNAAGTRLAQTQAQETAGIQAGRAGEMATAAGQLVGAEQGVRGQDIGTVGQQQQAELAQRQLNQQGQEFNEGLAFQTNAAQLQANQNAQGQANAMGEQNIENTAQSSNFGWGKALQVGSMITGAGTGGAGAALSLARPSPAPPVPGAARGGRLPHDRPYLVGEQGRELVAPDRDGFVLDALQTAKILGAPPTRQQLDALTPEQRQRLAEMRTPEHGGAHVVARALGGPIDPATEAQGGLGWTRAGYSPSNQYAEQNAIVSDAMHHAGSNPTGPASFAREEGGPIHAKEESAAEKLRRLGNRIAGSLTEAFAPAPIVVAPPHAPRAAVVTQAPAMEVYQAPDAPSMAPAGSGPVVVPTKVARVPAHDPSMPWSYAPVDAQGNAVVTTTTAPARAYGGPMRAEGGPVLADYLADERATAPDPYYQPPERGVAGAPRGYAASREGQPGYMFGDEQPATPGAPGDGNLAPGSADWAKYGAPAAKDKDPDWKRGGATTPAGAGASGGNWISKLLLGMSGGASNGLRPAPAYGGAR